MCGIAGFTRLNRRAPAGSGAAHHRSDVASRAGPARCVRRQRSDALRGPPEDHRSGGGDQPIVSDDGDTAIAFNGEIYNHREIRGGVGRHWGTGSARIATPKRCCGHFCSGTRRAFARMRGMFAIGVVDGIAEAPGAGARPDGHQAALLLPGGRRSVFRVGTEGDSGASEMCRGIWIWTRWIRTFR